eukprot:919710-Amphidinium_carterae.1
MPQAQSRYSAYKKAFRCTASSNFHDDPQHVGSNARSYAEAELGLASPIQLVQLRHPEHDLQGKLRHTFSSNHGIRSLPDCQQNRQL